MVIMFEIAGPFRLRGKIERAGPLTRFIWAWFSFVYLNAGYNDIARAIREDERQKIKQGSNI